MTNKLGLATYPSKFHDIKVSPTKICLQWSNVGVKLRNLGHNLDMLPKDPKTHQPVLKVSSTEVPMEILAVGCQMDVLKDVAMSIIKGYGEYSKEYRQTYKDTYGKELYDDLVDLYDALRDVIIDIEMENRE